MSMRLLTGLATGLVLLGMVGTADASPILVGGTDDLTTANGWTGDQAQQDNVDNVNWLVDFYNDHNPPPPLPSPLMLLGKWEVDDNGGGAWEEGTGQGFTGDFMGNDGDWLAPTGWSAPIYYSIKAGSGSSDAGFELYYANGDTSGTWDTAGLGNKGLSHISFWSSTPVPEPATMLLLGTGLIGLAGIRRKKKA